MKISITENGPYHVDSDLPLKEVESVGKGSAVMSYRLDKDLGVAEDTYLCRCGHSANKPFCDGHHANVHFDGAETNDRKTYDEKADFLPGEIYDALDNQELCAAARFCDRNPSFWGALETTDGKSVKEMGCNCASGRLTLLDKETGEKIEPHLEKEIYLVKDTPANHLGPIHVRGGVQVVGSDGFEYEKRNRVTLCRCGKSNNKPYCDATHLSCPHMEL